MKKATAEGKFRSARVENGSAYHKKWDEITMCRIKACAYIAMEDRADKIEDIADALECEPIEAATGYVIGALKAGIRRGTYRNYMEALDAFEREQVGDRGDGIGQLNELARDVRRINHINATTPTLTGFARDKLDAMAEPEKQAPKKSHARNMAKVYGSLYVQWDEGEAKLDVDYVMRQNDYNRAVLEVSATGKNKAIEAYIAEYIGRLSPTGQKTVREVCNTVLTVDEIMSAKHSDEAERMRNKVKYLFNGFPRHDVMSAREYYEILKAYA